MVPIDYFGTKLNVLSIVILFYYELIGEMVYIRGDSDAPLSFLCLLFGTHGFLFSSFISAASRSSRAVVLDNSFAAELRV